MEAGALLEGKRFCHDGRNHILPVCCLHLGGEVALPCHRVRATAQRQAARAPSPPSPAVARPAPTGPSSLAHPPLPFFSLGSRPAVRASSWRHGNGWPFTLFLPSFGFARDRNHQKRHFWPGTPPNDERLARTTPAFLRRQGAAGVRSVVKLCILKLKWRHFRDFGYMAYRV